VSVFGVDYSWGRPAIKAMVDAGVTFVCRYASHDDTGKNLTRAEAGQLSAADVALVLVWENGKDRARAGKAAGHEDALAASRLGEACGMPAGRPIYFAVDFDAQPAHLKDVLAYLDGAAEAIGRDRVGVYGGLRVVKAALDLGKARWAWQTYAWSGTPTVWDGRAQLQQYSNDHRVGGADVDYDRAVKTDFGQWKVAKPVEIISRRGWGARAPRSRTVTTWAHRTEFVVHHSEGPTTQTVRSIQDFHMDDPDHRWSDIGYNFLVDDKGRIYEGRGWLVVGAQAIDHNTSGIGVCFIGRDGSDVTAAAKTSIRWLYDEACRKAGRALAKRGHGQLSGNSTSCPGKTLQAWVNAGMPASVPVTDWMEAMVQKLPTLKKGDKGEHVETLRGLLLARSHPEVKTVEGPFDATVEAAVRAVQEWGKVGVDGIVGQDTWPVLLRVH
jgi:hypothetical protein